MSKKINILLVEDNEVDVMAIKRTFKKCQIDNPVYVAKDGIEALELLRDQTQLLAPCLILLDLNLPRMDGIEFLKELRQDPKLNKNIAFVLTTSKDHKDIQAAYNFNIAGYIVKSTQGHSLMDVAQMLNSYCKVIQFP